MPRTVEGCCEIRNAARSVDILRRFGCRIEVRVLQERFAQWRQTGFAGNLRFRPAFWLEGRIEVFELNLGLRTGDQTSQIRREVAL